MAASNLDMIAHTADHIDGYVNGHVDLIVSHKLSNQTEPQRVVLIQLEELIKYETMPFDRLEFQLRFWRAHEFVNK